MMIITNISLTNISAKQSNNNLELNESEFNCLPSQYKLTKTSKLTRQEGIHPGFPLKHRDGFNVSADSSLSISISVSGVIGPVSVAIGLSVLGSNSNSDFYKANYNPKSLLGWYGKGIIKTYTSKNKNCRTKNIFIPNKEGIQYKTVYEGQKWGGKVIK